MSGVLVAGIGNIFLGDDGFGPEVARRITAEPAEVPRGVRVVDYGIRGVHLAYDLLDGVDALVLVDALPGSDPPGTVSVLEVGRDDFPIAGALGVDAHDLHPTAVLASVEQMGGELPPTYVVGVQPEGVDEGIGLSAPVAAAVDGAVAAVRRLVCELVANRTLVADRTGAQSCA